MKTHYAEFEKLWNGQPSGWGNTLCGLENVKSIDKAEEVDCKRCISSLENKTLVTHLNSKNIEEDEIPYPDKWLCIENIIFPERKKVLDDIHLELVAANFSTLIPTDDYELAKIREGYIKGLEKAIEIVNNKMYDTSTRKSKTQTK